MNAAGLARRRWLGALAVALEVIAAAIVLPCLPRWLAGIREVSE